MELFQSLSLDIQLKIFCPMISTCYEDNMHGYGVGTVVGTIYKPDRVYRVFPPLSRVKANGKPWNLGTLGKRHPWNKNQINK